MPSHDELIAENRELRARLEKGEARVAALEAASDVSQISEDNLASLCHGLDERVLALETRLGKEGAGAEPGLSGAAASVPSEPHVCSPNKWSDACGGWICLCGKDLSANWYVEWRKENP